MLFQRLFGTFPLYHTILCHPCRAQTAVLFEKMHTHPKQKFILQQYLQNIRNVLHPVSIGSFNIHMSNYQPFPITGIEKQHRKQQLYEKHLS